MALEKDRINGCLLGGAIGDALGYPVEFMKHREITGRYGDDGIKDLQIASGGKSIVSDDTQMTLFTAEGILLTFEKERITDNIYLAYLRWLLTQGYNIPVVEEGWLVNDTRMHHRRAPGNSCLTALASGRKGSLADPINNSKGCGGVMRVAPIGVICPPEEAFRIGVETASITHGHPAGYYSAGALAMIISLIMHGYSMEDAVKEAIDFLKARDHEKGTLRCLETAYSLSQEGNDVFRDICLIGEGWTGDEALGIGVYCALRFKEDFGQALRAAVNHDGDSDSTGSITGNIMGAICGAGKIPEEWEYKVELRDRIYSLSERLYHKRKKYYK